MVVGFPRESAAREETDNNGTDKSGTDEGGETLSSLPFRKKRRDRYYQARVLCEVEGEWFWGTFEDVDVTEVTREWLYRVKCDDGDLLHLSASETREAVAAAALWDEESSDDIAEHPFRDFLEAFPPRLTADPIFHEKDADTYPNELTDHQESLLDKCIQKFAEDNDVSEENAFTQFLQVLQTYVEEKSPASPAATALHS